MTISALDALHAHRYVYFGFQSLATEDNNVEDIPTMAYSDNLVEWTYITKFKQLSGLRDGYLKKINDDYYIIGTSGFYKTTDFVSFKKLDYLKQSAYKTLWAPELFQDIEGQWHIVYCAGNADQGVLDPYIADFDPETDTISNQDQSITFHDDIDNAYKIDPDITVIDGVYYLTLGGNYVLSSNQYQGPYQKFPVNFASAPQKYGAHNSGIVGWTEGPNMFIDGDSVRLFSDQTDGNGLVFRSATKNDLFDWTDLEKTHSSFKMRHGSIVVNDKVSAEVDALTDGIPKFDSRISIQGLHDKQPVPLTCFMKNSFQYEYEDNQTNQISFVAYNDGSPSFAYIASESTIQFNNDLFVIKNVEEDDAGSELYTVTAIQYVNSEIGRVRQRNVRNGVLTYTINDVLNFFLNDKTANPFGFSFCVFGDFDKQQIENLGGCSGKDMISKINETWPGTIVYPKGKTLNVFAPNIFHKNYQRKIVYKHDTDDIKLIEDSTNIVNQVRCVGATKDNDSTDDSGDDFSGGLTESTVKMVTGADHTADFQADAKKYLGVPYVWGGHNKANPFGGMDCSGFVSQVYHDFGIEIPAYTVSMEADFHEISRDEVKAGDVGFWGPHGHTDHIVLFLDHNTMIYEPQPGESCKMATVGSYHPDWYARNDAMQAKINTKKVEDVPQATLTFKDDYSSSSTSGSSMDANATYYFQPFLIEDQVSIDQWGLHPGEDVQDDRFKDPDSMKKYGMKQLVPDPVISVEITMDGNVVPVPGEQAYLSIPERGTLIEGSKQGTQNAYTTNVTAVGFIWYPYDNSQGTDITYDNLPATILHAQTVNADLRRIEQLANAALDRMPQIFYSKEEPSNTQTLKRGAIWANPYSVNDMKEGDKNGGQIAGYDKSTTPTNINGS